ncbi:MAG: 30S ribosomal protein S17 [Candidatus Andersenbacteria bacterium]|nr:30S ribosomal protein S17 [Candidatus Andersenbacteria bacterium]
MSQPTVKPKIHATLEGKVVKKSGSKTVSVEVVRQVPHPLYRKTMRHSKRYLAHDAKETVQVGDVVKIVKTRPISKRKHWKVLAKDSK